MRRALLGVLASVAVGLVVVQMTCLLGCGGAVPRQFRPTERVTAWSNADWAMVLSTVVTDDGFVHHEKIAANEAGARDALYRYVGLIGEISPENRPELFPTNKDRLAYWINAYNAVCMYAVQKRGRPANVRDAGGVPYAIFYLDKFPFGGKEMTLDTVEKRFVRSVGDPRIHFALNCSSYSCPPLRREPYEPATLDDQFDDQGHRYLSDPRGLVRRSDVAQLSEIFRFYQDEFTSAAGVDKDQLLGAIQKYAPPGVGIASAKSYTFMKYDWSLNQAK